MNNSIATRALSDDQRRKLVALIAADPWCALVRAARSVGVTGSKGEIRKLLDADDRFQDALHDARGDAIDEVQSLRVANLFRKLGSIAENDESSSQFRAIQFGLGLRGIGVTEHAHVDVQVDGRVEIEDRSASLDAVAAILRAVGATDGSTVPQRALPAAPDALAEPSDG